MKILKTFSIPAPPDKVALALCSEAYQVEEGNSREDIAATRFKLVDRTDERADFEVHHTEYKRTTLGKIDRSGTVPSMTRHTWTARDRTLRWVYRNESESRVHLSGLIRLEPQGEGTQVTHELELEIGIPLIGGKIAKMVASELDADFPRQQALLARHAAKA